MSTSIRISGLNDYPLVRDDDFIPIVKSGSGAILTTYRTSVSSFNSWMEASGSALSSSYADSSSLTISSSWSDRGGYSISASYLIYPNNSTASYSLRSPFSDYSFSSSWASASISSSYSLVSVSSSYSTLSRTSSYSLVSISSSISDTASYYNFTLPENVPPFATSSLSSSWASQSLSSSHAEYAKTASVAIYTTTTYPYPYIDSIVTYQSHDDTCNVNFIGAPFVNYQNSNCLGWPITGHNGLPYTAKNERVDFDPVQGWYIAQQNGSGCGMAIGPSQHAVMFTDNRGGGPYGWYLVGDLYIRFCLAPGKYVDHQYITNHGAGNYAGMYARISAWRAALGLYAVLNDSNFLCPFGGPIIT